MNSLTVLTLKAQKWGQRGSRRKGTRLGGNSWGLNLTAAFHLPVGCWVDVCLSSVSAAIRALWILLTQIFTLTSFHKLLLFWSSRQVAPRDFSSLSPSLFQAPSDCPAPEPTGWASKFQGWSLAAKVIKTAPSPIFQSEQKCFHVFYILEFSY